MTQATTENAAADLAEQPVAASGLALPELTREQHAMALVKSYVPWSAGAGLLPMPLIDMAALVAVQLRMLTKLSALYQVPFLENGVKSTVSSLLGSVVSTSVGGALGSLVKAIPVVGPLIGIAAVPSVYSAATYAIGRVFVTHLAAGGTFLDFDADKMRAYFVAEYEKAKAESAPQKAA
jgi:uncharacterized protein (DUF697 family)